MPGIDDTLAFIPLSVAVLTVSDTRSPEDDKSGATLAERLTKAGHRLGDRAIVPDDVEAIREKVQGWIDDPAVDVIITTGGTGFTGRDVTPEAIEPLFEKFVRSGPPGTRGVGLGLPIARGIARAHGGDVTATNRAGGGARFVLHLPLGSEPPAAIELEDEA